MKTRREAGKCNRSRTRKRELASERSGSPHRATKRRRRLQCRNLSFLSHAVSVLSQSQLPTINTSRPHGFSPRKKTTLWPYDHGSRKNQRKCEGIWRRTQGHGMKHSREQSCCNDTFCSRSCGLLFVHFFELCVRRTRVVNAGVHHLAPWFRRAT